MSKKTTEAGLTPQGEIAPPSRWNIALKEMLGGSVVISILSVISALLVGAILIAVTDPQVHKATTYFFARPLSTFQAIWDSVFGAYSGAIYDVWRFYPCGYHTKFGKLYNRQCFGRQTPGRYP